MDIKFAKRKPLDKGAISEFMKKEMPHARFRDGKGLDLMLKRLEPILDEYDAAINRRVAYHAECTLGSMEGMASEYKKKVDIIPEDSWDKRMLILRQSETARGMHGQLNKLADEMDKEFLRIVEINKEFRDEVLGVMKVHLKSRESLFNRISDRLERLEEQWRDNKCAFSVKWLAGTFATTVTLASLAYASKPSHTLATTIAEIGGLLSIASIYNISRAIVSSRALPVPRRLFHEMVSRGILPRTLETEEVSELKRWEDDAKR